MPASRATVQIVPLEPRLLSLKDAAKYLGCSFHFVRSKVWAKELAVIRLGKKFVIEKTDLDAWVDRQKAVG